MTWQDGAPQSAQARTCYQGPGPARQGRTCTCPVKCTRMGRGGVAAKSKAGGSRGVGNRQWERPGRDTPRWGPTAAAQPQTDRSGTAGHTNGDFWLHQEHLLASLVHLAAQNTAWPAPTFSCLSLGLALNVKVSPPQGGLAGPTPRLGEPPLPTFHTLQQQLTHLVIA